MSMLLSGKIKNIESKLFHSSSKINLCRGDTKNLQPAAEHNIIKMIKNSSQSYSLCSKTYKNIPKLPITLLEIDVDEPQKAISNSHLIEPPQQLVPQTIPMLMKKYTFKSDKSNHIYVPPEFSTDDDYQKTLLDLFNEGIKGWSRMDSKNDIIVYKKNNVVPIMVKSYFPVNFPREVIVEALNNFHERKKWDKGFKDAILIDEKLSDEKNEQITYFKAKNPIPFTKDKEMIRLKTSWSNCPNDKTTLIHVTSVNHPDYPITKKFDRTQVIITGYFIEEIEPNKCNLGIINQLDLGLPELFMSQVLPRTVYGWYDNIQNGSKHILGLKNMKEEEQR